MKLKQMTLIAALALGSLLTIGTTVNAQDTTMTAPAATPPARPARGGRQLTIEQLTTALTLTDDQKPKVQALLDDQTKQITDLRADTSVAAADRRTKMQAIRADFTTKLNAILTPDQQAKFKMLQPARRQAPAAPAPAPAGN
jgi:Spy/CpxP family protein refolding chaperone